MKYFFILFIGILCFKLNSQNINVNDEFNYNLIRNSSLSEDSISNYSLNIRPINSQHTFLNKEYKTIYSNKNKSIELKSLGLDYFLEFNSHHPYNRNNGTMIPNRGINILFLQVFILKLDLLQFSLNQNIIFLKIKI